MSVMGANLERMDTVNTLLDAMYLWVRFCLLMLTARVGGSDVILEGSIGYLSVDLSIHFRTDDVDAVADLLNSLEIHSVLLSVRDVRFSRIP
jgi:hypothetical protein